MEVPQAHLLFPRGLGCEGTGAGMVTCSGERPPAKEGSWQRPLVRLDSFLKGGNLAVYLCAYDICGPVSIWVPCLCLGARFCFGAPTISLACVGCDPHSPCFPSSLVFFSLLESRWAEKAPALRRAGHLACAGPWAGWVLQA